MDTKKLSTVGLLPLYSTIILAVGLMNHVIVLPPLLGDAKRDAWLSVLATVVPMLIWTFFLFCIMKRTNQQPLLPWLKQQYGSAVSLAFRFFFIFYLFSMSVLTLKETTMWTHVSYLPRTPMVVLAGSLLVLCGFAVKYGIRAIAIASGILLPFVIIFGDFVMSANLPRKDYSLLAPFLENGIQPMLNGTIYVGGGLVELIIILLFQHRFQKKIPYWSLGLLALFLILLVFGPVTGAIAEFGPAEAATLRYPAYEEWRLVQIGKYIRHVDFLSIYQWLSGAFVRISISMMLLIDLIASDSKKKKRTIWLFGLFLLLLILVMLPVSDMQYLAFLKNVYLPAALWVVTGVMLLLFILVMSSKKAGISSYESS